MARRKDGWPLIVVWTTAFLPREVAPWGSGEYERALAALNVSAEFDRIADEPWFQVAERSGSRPELGGFAWEIEFPDVFFDEHGRLPQGGFDAIIGNPPYDVLSEAESGRDLAALRKYIDFEPAFKASQRGKNNLYKLFICRALQRFARAADKAVGYQAGKFSRGAASRHLPLLARGGLGWARGTTSVLCLHDDRCNLRRADISPRQKLSGRVMRTSNPRQ